MSRIEDSANATELAKPAVWLAILAEFDFPSGMLYASDAIHWVTYAGNGYYPTGEVASIGGVQEEVETIARSVTCVLGGPAEMVAHAMDEVYQGRGVTLRLAPLSESTGQPVGTPEILWEGRMDVMTPRAEKGVGVIELTCEHRLRREPRIARMTNVDQQMAYSGDTFFEHTPEIPGYVATWGATPIAFYGPGRGSLGSTGTTNGGEIAPPGRGYVKPV